MTSVQTLKEQNKILTEKVDFLEQDNEHMQLRLSVCQKNFKLKEKQLSLETTRYYTAAQYLQQNYPDIWVEVMKHIGEESLSHAGELFSEELCSRSLEQHKLRQEANKHFGESND